MKDPGRDTHEVQAEGQHIIGSVVGKPGVE